jgi:hypothetical protein
MDAKLSDSPNPGIHYKYRDLDNKNTRKHGELFEKVDLEKLIEETEDRHISESEW